MQIYTLLISITYNQQLSQSFDYEEEKVEENEDEDEDDDINYKVLMVMMNSSEKNLTAFFLSEAV